MKLFDFLKFKNALAEYGFYKYYPNMQFIAFRLVEENILEKYAEEPLETFTKKILDSYKELENELGEEILFRKFRKLSLNKLPVIIIEKDYINVSRYVYPVTPIAEEIFAGDKIKIFFPIQSAFTIYLSKIVDNGKEEVTEVIYIDEMLGIMFYAELNSAF